MYVFPRGTEGTEGQRGRHGGMGAKRKEVYETDKSHGLTYHLFTGKLFIASVDGFMKARERRVNAYG